MTYDEYITRNEARLTAAYYVGRFYEDMDFDQFALECYSDYMVNTLAA